MTFVQEPGNKRFPCPACQAITQVSIQIGYQTYLCARAQQEVTIEDQVKTFNEEGITEGIDLYERNITAPSEIIHVSRFPILGEWCYQVALRHGYPDMEAYSLALARARAESANSNIRTISEFTYDGQKVSPRVPPKSTIEVIKKPFMGVDIPTTLRPNGQLMGVYFKNDIPQLCKPDIFEQIVINKLKYKNYKVVQRALRNLSKCFSLEDLNKNGSYLWQLLAPIGKGGGKPEPGEPGLFQIGVVDNMIETFSVPYNRWTKERIIKCQ